MTDRFTGRVAVITGGASGIGAATARLLAKEGAKLVLADINADAGAAMVSELSGSDVHFIRTDVSSVDDIRALIDETVKLHGRIDILFNNAGIGSFGNTVETTIEQWQQVIAIDLNAIFYACHYAIPHMPKGSAILNTASISGLGGDHRFAAYNAAKGGVINYTKSLAVDHARDGIRVNAL
ncbi:MAG: 3-oxoacyl-ACP reductase, partial [Ponticaulis sp.]|nr:3-oxoacyl-ACP reductase [Ponticaulis sp.]